MISAEANRAFQLACESDATVLITGPTGSGKTRLAKEIHESSERRGKPFVTVNLATLHEGTLESELFGHERGAFTGADQKRMGRLEAANGGTVFLDEIGELPPRIQCRLLEFLQSRAITPVGSNRELRLNVRVIIATHRELETAVRRKEFREDLFHRMRVIALDLKPIQERSEDFGELVHECLAEICAEKNRAVSRISSEFAEKLEAYAWPGNFRELRNVLEYAVISCERGELTVGDLPSWFASPRESGSPAIEAVISAAEWPAAVSFSEAVSHFEKVFLEQALRKQRGRVQRTARAIGLSKSTLLRRIHAYGIQPWASKSPNALDYEISSEH